MNKMLIAGLLMAVASTVHAAEDFKIPVDIVTQCDSADARVEDLTKTFNLSAEQSELIKPSDKSKSMFTLFLVCRPPHDNEDFTIWSYAVGMSTGSTERPYSYMVGQGVYECPKFNTVKCSETLSGLVEQTILRVRGEFTSGIFKPY